MKKTQLYKKSFGQHFLQNQHTLRKICATINPKKTQHLVEIGPGAGALTNLLSETDCMLDIIEIDKDLIGKLSLKFYNTPLINIYQSDILKFDLIQLIKENKKLRITGNLPYNISTPLLFKLFDNIDIFQDMHFLLQKEVALRLVAQPGESNYNRLSVMTQYFCDNVALFDIPPQDFYPAPKVNSTFIKMIPKVNREYIKDIKLFTELVKISFNQRRKIIQNNLQNCLSADELIKLNINPKSRPQQLTINHFVKISNFLYDRGT